MLGVVVEGNPAQNRYCNSISAKVSCPSSRRESAWQRTDTTIASHPRQGKGAQVFTFDPPPREVVTQDESVLTWGAQVSLPRLLVLANHSQSKTYTMEKIWGFFPGSGRGRGLGRGEEDQPRTDTATESLPKWAVQALGRSWPSTKQILQQHLFQDGWGTSCQNC